MELFSDSSQKLKEALEDAGIDSDFEYDFQKTVENKIERSTLDASDIEPKLNYLVDQLSTITDGGKGIVSTSSPKKRTLKFLINQDHNIKTCPECESRVLKSDKYCFKCGLKLSMDYEDELSDLEKLYDKKISHKTDNNFKYAYVIYLDYLNKHGRAISESEIKAYNVSLDKLSKKALKDGYDKPGKAIEFINDNKHVIFYNSHSDLKNVINIDLYEDIFEDKNKTSKKAIVETIVGYLTRQYYITLRNYEIRRFYNVLSILSKSYEYLGDVDSALKSNFKMFMLDLNNFEEDLKKSEACKAKINPETVDKLTELLDKHSVTSAELKDLFNKAYKDISELNPQITSDESLIYFLRIFNGEKISDVEKSLHLKYS